MKCLSNFFFRSGEHVCHEVTVRARLGRKGGAERGEEEAPQQTDARDGGGAGGGEEAAHLRHYWSQEVGGRLEGHGRTTGDEQQSQGGRFEAGI